jgi:hypothetical protein
MLLKVREEKFLPFDPGTGTVMAPVSTQRFLTDAPSGATLDPRVHRAVAISGEIMMRIVCATDCGNSPKRLLLRDFSSALARGSDARVLKYLTDDIVWEWVGAPPLRGKNVVAQMLKRMKQEARQELVIENIITHGGTGSVNGTMRLTNGRSYGFCHVFVFSGAAGKHIQRITSYEIRK